MEILVCYLIDKCNHLCYCYVDRHRNIILEGNISCILYRLTIDYQTYGYITIKYNSFYYLENGKGTILFPLNSVVNLGLPYLL